MEQVLECEKIMNSEGTFSYADGFVEFGAGVIIPTFDVYSDVSLTAILLSIRKKSSLCLKEKHHNDSSISYVGKFWEYI